MTAIHINDGDSGLRMGEENRGLPAQAISSDADSGTQQWKEKYTYDDASQAIQQLGHEGIDRKQKLIHKRTDQETSHTASKTVSGVSVYGFRYMVPEMGRWASRDPIEEDGGVNLYGVTKNNFICLFDFLGLKLGVDDGAASIEEGAEKLKKACEKCCSCDSKTNVRTKPCGESGCIADSKQLVYYLKKAWKDNYDQGPYTGSPGDTVGCYFCWDWAKIFEQAATDNADADCISFKIGMAEAPAAPGGGTPVHYYLEVYACGREDDECKVSFDDGFFDGSNASHSGEFPKPGVTSSEGANRLNLHVCRG